MKREQGFTLFEMVVVFALIAVFILVGGFGFVRLQRTFLVRSSADEIRSLFQQARELTVANKDQTTYKVTINNQIALLRTAGDVELKRYQVPVSVTLTPASLTWSFVPVTGAVTGCSAPCQLTLTAGDSAEIINIAASGLIE